MHAEPENNTIQFTADEARTMSSALADVLCWFRGFQSAKPKAQLPPGIDDLRSLNLKLKDLNWENEK